MSGLNSALQPSPRETQIAQRDPVSLPCGQQLLGTSAICLLFGICRHTWHRWVKSGWAPEPVSLPGHPRWDVDDIERFRRGRYRQGR